MMNSRLTNDVIFTIRMQIPNKSVRLKKKVGIVLLYLRQIAYRNNPVSLTKWHSNKIIVLSMIGVFYYNSIEKNI